MMRTIVSAIIHRTLSRWFHSLGVRPLMKLAFHSTDVLHVHPDLVKLFALILFALMTNSEVKQAGRVTARRLHAEAHNYQDASSRRRDGARTAAERSFHICASSSCARSCSQIFTRTYCAVRKFCIGASRVTQRNSTRLTKFHDVRNGGACDV